MFYNSGKLLLSICICRAGKRKGEAEREASGYNRVWLLESLTFGRGFCRSRESRGEQSYMAWRLVVRLRVQGLNKVLDVGARPDQAEREKSRRAERARSCQMTPRVWDKEETGSRVKDLLKTISTLSYSFLAFLILSPFPPIPLFPFSSLIPSDMLLTYDPPRKLTSSELSLNFETFRTVLSLRRVANFLGVGAN